jgi:hypothetical protein
MRKRRGKEHVPPSFGRLSRHAWSQVTLGGDLGIGLGHLPSLFAQGHSAFAPCLLLDLLRAAGGDRGLATVRSTGGTSRRLVALRKCVLASLRRSAALPIRESRRRQFHRSEERKLSKMAGVTRHILGGEQAFRVHTAMPMNHAARTIKQKPLSKNFNARPTATVDVP